MIVNADEIIKNKPKDCKLCPKSLCREMTATETLYNYYNHSTGTAIYPPCINKGSNKFKITNYKQNHKNFEKFYLSLVAAIDSLLDRPTCDLEAALQLTKIRNMI